MKVKPLVFLFGIASAVALTVATAQSPSKNVTHGPATIKELMTLIVEPASNGVFQAASEAPKNDAGWKTLQGQALTLVEIANSLTAPNRSKDRKQWLQFSRAFQAESQKAFDAATAKDAGKLGDLSDSLYTTCANCHEHYLPKSGA